ncbi:MAG: cation-translocating P-type ATPase [Oscillospiraceae bacterium]
MTDYTGTILQQLDRFGTDPHRGLTFAEASDARATYGENVLTAKQPKSLWMRFLLQLKDAMVIILIIAAVISFVLALFSEEGEFIDSIIILAIVVLNASLGVSQESKAQKSLDALKRLSAPSAKVLREGTLVQIPAADLVPGDIVVMEAGDFVPADCRLIESASLACEESALTGESVPVEKDAAAQVAEDAPLGDRLNMVYSGCVVTYGRGKALVTATGMNTEMGKIATLLDSEEEEATPLLKRLAQLSKYLGMAALAVCAVIFLTGILQGIPVMQMFMTAVSLAVAAIPEGMTAVVTVVLALGVRRMVERGAIVRRLSAVETLGSASVICTDKTGTLTLNQMTVRKVWAAREKVQELSEKLSDQGLHLLRLGTLCSDGRVELSDGEKRHIGDPTETAIVAAALDAGLVKSQLEAELPRVAELPFDSERKLMTTVHSTGDQYLVITKGGFDVLLPLCVQADMAAAEQVNQTMGEDALRVLAVACRKISELPEEVSSQTLETDLTFVGLIGMIDPPREESREAVELCAQAGIRTIMITGDHVVTARAIAKELGILREGEEAVSGQELSAMDDETLMENIHRYSVYARVSPQDKIRIVKAWQSRGKIVSMTGDGVNDAPALRAADIGCAMGITGTDVAKDAADMVLTDDNFFTIVEAVRQGRGIFDNIQKTIQFLISCNLGEILVIFIAMMLGWGTPLLAIHLLLINVVTDALPALALGLEPVDQDIMKRKPIPANQGIFAGKMGVIISLQGLMVGALTLTGYYIGLRVPVSSYVPPSQEVGMTMAFLVLCLGQLAQALNCRSDKSLFKIGFFSNRAMVQAVAVSGFVAILLCLVPALEIIFKLHNLSMLHWVWVIVLSVAPLALTELAKAFYAAAKQR